ncbi:rab-GTPase-TBC domain-containing protein [Emericellopsis atlantica]|uniref:Rab-GTPase-TBC domain-containing protein n=1 Tax=Emericellopsis atlantica TaxID=2614577 RepID=A0A9P7ZEI7_9HYPO|nr:rab-GTPase-TBC domain-containing protein [Emericellopsis atlantica]KAG9250008.1 rab-GTPase-TBC domain-containing protein [Emericellopsis atlantica]
MASPPREPIPSLKPSLLQPELQPPPSPRTHRALRRLQSAHTLGASNRNSAHIPSQPSLISQQRQQQNQNAPNSQPVQRNGSPTRSTRGRANSDATPPLVHQMNAVTAAKRPGSRKPVFSHGHLSLDKIIRDGPADGDYIGALESARWKVVDEGIKSADDGMSTVRIYVWLVLLNAPILSTDDYLALIHRGASPAYSKIRNDTFRTLTTDPLFRRRVSEASLIRLLNAIAWTLQDAREEDRLSGPRKARSSMARASLASNASDSSQGRKFSPTQPLTDSKWEENAVEPGVYVQGMNVLAAPFLYAARSEAEAFAAFHTLLTRDCPGYIRGAMDGVHRGLALVDKVLAIVDPKLAMYLTAKGLSAEIYAFPSVLTLCACTPPLPEVLRLWDFLFAYGPHLNIVCIVAQLTIMRTQILTSASPNKVLRSFPQLNADLVKSVTIGIIKKIPDDVYNEIVNHAL